MKHTRNKPLTWYRSAANNPIKKHMQDTSGKNRMIGL
jgi:hypothetical protein